MWTVFVFAFLKFLSALGLKSAASDRQPAAQQPAAQPDTQRGVQSPAPFIPAAADPPPCELPYGLPYEGFLPPTIKQRIRAEAHGSTPTARRICRGSADVAGTASTSASTGAIPAPRGGHGAELGTPGLAA